MTRPCAAGDASAAPPSVRVRSWPQRWQVSSARAMGGLPGATGSFAHWIWSERCMQAGQ